MKKTTTTKILGSLLILLLIGTIGAAMVSADDTTTNLETEQKGFGNQPPGMYPPPFLNELTDEQKTEIKNLVETMKDEEETKEEIQTAVQEKLEEWDITLERPSLTDEARDENLAKKIEHTEKRLEIMNRVQELRDQGYEFEDIKDIIKEEYNIDPPIQPHCRNRRQKGRWNPIQETPEEEFEQ